MTRLGYARASTDDQDFELQIRELEAAGCERIYRDHGISGTKTSRPELDEMLDRLIRGDVVWKLDRLRGNMRDLLELLGNVKACGIKFRSLREGIATTDPGCELGGVMVQTMVTIISVFAQLECGQFSVCTKASMGVAASRGRKAGRLLSACEGSGGAAGALVLGVVSEVGEGDVGVVEEVVGVDELAHGGGACAGPVWGLLCCLEADVGGDFCCAGCCEVAGGGVPVGIGGVDPELGV